jgi:chloramphenicol-sensitive protein RarD
MRAVWPKRQSKSLSSSSQGAIYAVLAYSAWGLLTLYWHLLNGVAPLQIFAHRVIWASLFFFILLVIVRRKNIFRELWASRRHLKGLLLSSSLIGLNWITYITAINTGQVLESSLGYFITPLCAVFLGCTFLKERLSSLQKLSVVLALAGILQLAFQGNHFPFIALTLAFTFASYGLVRKKIQLDPLLASTVESALMAGPAMIYLALSPTLSTTPNYTTQQWGLLILSGVITALPLLSFVQAGKMLKLSTLGFFQYIAPTIQFFLAVFYFGETFTNTQLSSFACIWLALIVFAMHFWSEGREFKFKVRLRKTSEPVELRRQGA